MRTKTIKIRQVWRGAVLLFAAGVLILPAVTALAQQSGGIGGRVANPDPDNPRSQSIFIYTLERGESKNDQILVINPTDEEQTISLGSVDGVVTNTGDYTCRQESEPVEDSGGWVKLAKTEVTVPAGGEEKVDFTVTVPELADVGEHNSCLTIQANQNKDEGEEIAPGVRLRMRQAIRMITTIPGDLKRELSIEDFTINQGNEQQRYSLTAANTGNVSADIDMRIRLTSLFDHEVANVGDEYPIVPGESLTKEFTTQLKPMFGGWYKVTPSLRYDKRLGAFGTQNEQAEYETLTGEPREMFFWPTLTGWAIIAAIILLLHVFVWQIISRVRRHNQLKKGSSPYVVEQGDTIQSLAEEANVSWKDLAKLNALSAPYTLNPGQRILLPGVRKPSSQDTNTLDDIPEDIFPVRHAKRAKHASAHHVAPHKKATTTRKKPKKG